MEWRTKLQMFLESSMDPSLMFASELSRLFGGSYPSYVGVVVPNDSLCSIIPVQVRIHTCSKFCLPHAGSYSILSITRFPKIILDREDWTVVFW
jgi:hypothetical protein